MPSLHQFRHHLHDARKQIEELEQQVALYEELLQHLRFRVDTQDAELIARTLHRRSSITGPPSPDPVSATHPTPTQPSVAVDYVEEDYHRNQQLPRIRLSRVAFRNLLDT
ncbi:hypothetical protein KXV22_008274 [Aspergillus fumigatus]|uniref:Uncharacterized protein n=1 Tax=Aspergillus fumigatus TaxID=746128 RepID=A0A9P8SRG5_ASPFM|nr:hypothetical protein KXX64_005212 [Aspergillus fumigatus]KAH1437686.1 hypothetical protein KXX32_001620 [Aspergillus fumigatus]KAH1585871.1 hypothetical protein KXX69_008035 [Aspergillus fumigatus]KAH1759373.1 hypothetical protein KXX41_005995 [Aspergillus fumigatus]KAH1759657.1 hypothetical protein KXX09_001573 [Aspergillus fumigatus]